MGDGTRSVAIACQGGGSHTAFTAGVLRRLFRELDPTVDVVGLSGTSEGAMCALLARYGRAHPDRDPGDHLVDFRADPSARRPAHRVANGAIRWGIELGRMGVSTPDVSPYSPDRYDHHNTKPGARIPASSMVEQKRTVTAR